MTKQVLLSITGLQFADETLSEPLEMLTIADYYFRNGTHFLLYEEAVEDSTEKIKNSLKIKKNHVEIIRRGTLNTDMVFEKGKLIGTSYSTPYGKLTLGIRTHEMTCEESDDQITVFLKYGIEVEGEYLSDNEVKIKVCSREIAKDFLFKQI